MCDMATYPELPRECRWETGFQCQAKRELKAVPRLKADSPSNCRLSNSESTRNGRGSAPLKRWMHTSSTSAMEGYSSGLRGLPTKHLGGKPRLGSNPSPSVQKEVYSPKQGREGTK